MYELAQSIRIGPGSNWELVISPDDPIIFTRAESDDRIQPDIFCEITASTNEEYPLSHLRLVLRAWSIQDTLSYRRNWDSENVMEKMRANYSINRVMSRCHYDTCSEGQYAPFYHFQFHGTPQENEVYWFPTNIDFPHFPSPPIDLILACEIVVATYFPDTYQDLLQDGNWVNLIKESEVFILSNYYKKCIAYLDNNPKNKTLLDYFCDQPN